MPEHAAISIMIATATPIIPFTLLTRLIRIIVTSPPAGLPAGERYRSKERAPARGPWRPGGPPIRRGLAGAAASGAVGRGATLPGRFRPASP
jgi:hypothetical protein